jgi:hypothetical protein
MVKRYFMQAPTEDDRYIKVNEIESDKGYWVTYPDYAALAERCERLEAEVIELSWCLWSFMDGTQDHDIQAETGYPDEDCERIAAGTRTLA